VDLRRQSRVVEREQGFFIGEDVATAGLGFQFVELFQQFLVARSGTWP
jgi:hypothetical protein